MEVNGIEGLALRSLVLFSKRLAKMLALAGFELRPELHR
jgi:hypothetical protein